MPPKEDGIRQVHDEDEPGKDDIPKMGRTNLITGPGSVSDIEKRGEDEKDHNAQEERQRLFL